MPSVRSDVPAVAPRATATMKPELGHDAAEVGEHALAARWAEALWVYGVAEEPGTEDHDYQADGQGDGGHHEAPYVCAARGACVEISPQVGNQPSAAG